MKSSKISTYYYFKWYINYYNINLIMLEVVQILNCLRSFLLFLFFSFFELSLHFSFFRVYTIYFYKSHYFLLRTFIKINEVHWMILVWCLWEIRFMYFCCLLNFESRSILPRFIIQSTAKIHEMTVLKKKKGKFFFKGKYIIYY